MPVSSGIFSYAGGWTFISVILLGLSGWSSPSHAGEKRLEVVLVMDNSTSMARSDNDFKALAAADLMVGLLGPDDRLSLVSAGAEASVVLADDGRAREKFRAALRRLHREASSSDPLAVMRLLEEHFASMEMDDIIPLVIWFSGTKFTYNTSNEEYYVVSNHEDQWSKAMESKAYADDPWKVKSFRDMQPDVLDGMEEILDPLADELGRKGIPVHIVLSGKSWNCPGVGGDDVFEMMSDVAKRTGGDVSTSAESEDGIVEDVLSIFVRRVNAPTKTLTDTVLGRRGESFEVFRGCRHLWVVMTFDRLPVEIGLTSEKPASEDVVPWPFGKPEDDVYHLEPHIEKGLEYKDKRWYQLPEAPTGFSVYSVKDPLDGNYRIRAEFDEGEDFTIRIVQVVDLEYGFLDPPPSSLPLGLDFTTVAALKHPEGFTYVFNRDFLEDLRFQVLVRRADGSIPEWGRVRTLTASREGETAIDFSPDEPGTYYLKGRVSHVDGEFETYMRPRKFVVYEKLPIDFEPVEMTWSAKEAGTWTRLSPPVSILEGLALPEDVSVRVRVDYSGIEGSEGLEFHPAESFVVDRETREVQFRVRHTGAGASRFGENRYPGVIVLEVDEAQRQNVQGTGRWEIPVEGRLQAWGIGRLHDEYRHLFWLAVVALIVAFVLVERLLRPAFPRPLVFGWTESIGGRRRTWRIEAGRRMRPILPFARQSIVIGRGGDAALYRDDVLCVIVPRWRGVWIVPRSAAVIVDGAQRRDPVPARFGQRYEIGGDQGGLEFWLELEPISADETGGTSGPPKRDGKAGR